MKQERVRINFLIGSPLNDKLEKYCQETGMTRTQVIITAVSEYLLAKEMGNKVMQDILQKTLENGLNEAIEAKGKESDIFVKLQ